MKTWDIVQEFYGAFGFTLRTRLSFHDPAHPEKYLGGKSKWAAAESILREITEEKGADTFEGPGEAAFYGPKLDFMAKDSLGREWQVATIQIDMNMPERFDLTCINEKGEKERVVMIHAAIMGSIERFLAVIIEHLGGTFPLWLSPIQARVLPIGERHHAFAREALAELQAVNIRADIDESGKSLGKKVRSAKEEKIPYLLVIGDTEVESKTASLEGRAEKFGTLPIADITSKLQKEIFERR